MRLVLAATLLTGCTPDVASTEGAGGAATATTGATTNASTATTATVGSGSTSSGSTITTTTSSGATSSSTSGSGGPTCSDATVCHPEADAGCAIACATGDVCDCDGDGFTSDAPGCGAPATPDCFDCNPAVHPGQTAFFTQNRGDGSFDFDCDATQEPQWTGTCPSASPCSPYKAFTTQPKCGNPGDLHDCEGILTCMKTPVSVPDVLQACR